MEIKKSVSTDFANYEILLRMRDKDHIACYCPQINYMIKGKNFDWVKTAMKDKILEHIEALEVEMGDIHEND